jgi:hypothetical protein
MLTHVTIANGQSARPAADDSGPPTETPTPERSDNVAAAQDVAPLASPKEILDHARSAIGNDASLNTIESVHIKNRVTTPKGKAYTIETRSFGDRILIEQKNDENVESTGMNDSWAWFRKSDKVDWIASPNLSTDLVAIARRRQFSYMIVPWLAEYPEQFELTAIRTIRDQRCYELTLDHSDRTFEYYFDVDTFKYVAVRTTDKWRPNVVIEYYSAFQTFNGITLATRREIMRENSTVASLLVTEFIAFNTLDETDVPIPAEVQSQIERLEPKIPKEMREHPAPPADKSP